MHVNLPGLRVLSIIFLSKETEPNGLTRKTDGATRIGATVFQELRNAIFATVAQKAIRRVACSVYEHLLRLDLNFHLTRQTGGLTRAIDRGTKGISFLLSSMVFHVGPTALEISLVCGILVRIFKDKHSKMMPCGQSTHDFKDLPIWCQICSHNGCNHGRIHSLHHFDNFVAHQI